MSKPMLEDLRIEDQKEIKRLITTDADLLVEEEVRAIHARREYLSPKIIALFKGRFEELGLFGFEVSEKKEEKVEKK